MEIKKMTDKHFFTMIDLERLKHQKNQKIHLTCPHCQNTFQVTLLRVEGEPDKLEIRM